MIKISIKSLPLEELQSLELYQLFQLRNEVFVVEQNCVYQDIDDTDQVALHVLLQVASTVQAYARIYWTNGEAHIGRVVVRESERGNGYARMIMLYCLEQIQISPRPTETIVLSAQLHLVTFYYPFGFVSTGEEYLEDGIPHIKMFVKI